MQNSPARSSIDVGSVIRDTYTIEALIGRGGMGAVFLASHNRLPGKKVAIKVLHADLSGEEIQARFEREAKIASLLSHPNIVHIEDYNVTPDGMPFLVLEYLQGESLAQRIRRGPLGVEDAFSIIRQVGSALAAAHGKGIVHRDLKPQNIFLVASEIDGRSLEIAKVLDFGISKWRDSQTVKTQDTALLGTPQYMAPEQALGQHDKVDERTDIFALGAIVYEMLSGTPAFAGQTIPEVVFKVVYEQPVELGTRVPTLPESIKAAVARALAKPAAERFPTVTSFIEALTGSPLSTIRTLPPVPLDSNTPITGGSGARTPHTGREAFEATMGSGEHGASPLAGHAPTVDSQALRSAPTVDSQAPIGTARVDGAAPTVSSQSGGARPPQRDVFGATAPTVSSSSHHVAPLGGPLPAATESAAAPHKRTALLAIGVLLAAAVAAVVMYLVMREPTHEQISRVEPAPIAPPAATGGPAGEPASGLAPGSDGPATGMEPSAGAADGSGGAADATAPGTPPPDRRDVTKRTRGGAEDSATGGDSTRGSSGDDDLGPEGSRAGKKLRDAEAAVRAGDWSAVQANANMAFRSEGALPRQRMLANALRGIAACMTNDAEAAGTLLNQISKPRLRQRVLRACHAQGYLEHLRR